MDAKLLLASLLLIIGVHYAAAGEGIEGGKLDFTMYLGNKPRCGQDDDCITTCKEAAKSPENITGARCIKFVGNFNRYCCCYTDTTNACCQRGNSGLDCVPSDSPNNAVE